MNERLHDLIARVDWSQWQGVAKSAVRIVLIVALAWVSIRVLQRLVRGVRQRVAAHLGGVEAARRAETVGRVIRYLIALVVGAVAFMLVMAEIGISLAPILGAAGVVGLAIGFGAQSLVKDYFTGFFLLFEDQIRTGDVVNIAGIGGLVEDITLRHVRLRDYDGNVHFIPNSLITSVTNMSRTYAHAVMDIGVAYREDVDAVIDVMRGVGAELRGDPAFATAILEDLEIAGVERLDDSAVVLRCRFKVAPLQQWNVRRDYFRRIKAAFDRENIEIPYPHVTMYAGVGKDGTAPEVPLRIRRPPPTTRSTASSPPTAEGPVGPS